MNRFDSFGESSSAKVKISLRFRHTDLDPNEITRLLNVEPSFAHRKGDTWASPQDRGPSPDTPGVWILNGPTCSNLSFDKEFQFFLDRLPDDLGIWKSLEKWGGEVFVGYFAMSVNTGFALTSSTLRLLADRYLSIDLDIYTGLESDGDPSN